MAKQNQAYCVSMCVCFIIHSSLKTLLNLNDVLLEFKQYKSLPMGSHWNGSLASPTQTC